MRRRHKRKARRTLRLRLRENTNLSYFDSLRFGEEILREHGLDNRGTMLIKDIFEEQKVISNKLAQLVAESRAIKSHLTPKIQSVLGESEAAEAHLASIIRDNRK